ncbi:c-type cytochrome domain-containing protein [Dyadobacter sp. CY312]|uniref:c-type cytochrome domain-containing protein n=1 Tax=Dyadobacter sp. CY312 TaxID=2907303 RepID=UPI001F202F89|nr:c-type cytochrome domain-containing protein [Dyadobacter sp. CY312]MCE7042090.1 ribonuclease inhibitor [Dyadobacter sp. CY312]
MFLLLFQASGWFPNFAIFIGRFHPVLVHLPIGFLFIAALLEIGRRAGKIGVSESAISFILFWSSVSATFACIAGYLLSLGGGYDEKLLSDHQWQGIGVAAFAWIAWLVKSDRFGDKIPFGPAFYLPAFGLATILTMTAGHDGGSLTHGEGFLTQYTPEPFRSIAGMSPIQEKVTEIKPIENVEQAVVYRDIVQPILEMRCTQCHNANKQKGDLRLDELSLMQKGGESGPAFVAGKGSESDMVKRCLLDEEDDDRMPPKGKPQLTSAQITLISWWIDQGAPAEKKVSELKISDAVKPALASLGKNSTPDLAESKSKISPVLALKVPVADEKAIEALKKAGLIVNNLSHDQNLIEVSAVNAPQFGDSQMALLIPLAEQITWLKLGGTKITNAAMKEIAKLKNLNKLHLEHTGITDAGITNLKNLPYLEYINLVDTKVTDSGLKDIAVMKGLKSVYVWKSVVTDSAIGQVRKQYPGLVIVNGFNEAEVTQFLKAGDTTAKEDILPVKEK